MEKSSSEKACLKGLLGQIRALLAQNDQLATYFRSELEWLDKREKLWQRDAFRVGLVGVTSSGKSTLVNALLEAKLLPDAVRPSSNCLVVCEWGEVTEGVIHFKDPARKPRVLHDGGIHASLARFADEKTNPGNREGVDEIRVRSPRFRFGPGVALIDTPGLDAYGHDDHEKLTLEVLLPTVDVVLFLATCKANSDAKIRDYVCLARDHGKPVIVVQNMVDSVVEKLGSNGHVIESRNQVLEKHLHRVQSVLKRAGVEAVSVSQVSAQWALRGRLAESGVPALVAGVRAQLDALVPAIIDGRLQQLKRWLGELVRKESIADDPEQLETRYRANLKQLQELAADIEARYRKLEGALQNAQYAASREAAELLSATADLGARQVDDAYTLKTKVEKWLRASPAALSELNRRFVAEVRQDCERLNLRLDDIDLGWSPARSSESLSFETVERSRRRRVEQSGAWGWIKRKADFFDKDWGYDEHSERWTEIKDLKSFCATVVAVTQREEGQVASFVERMQQRTQDVHAQFINDVLGQQRAIHTKMKTVADMAQRKAIAARLAALDASAAKAVSVGARPPTEIAGLRLTEQLHEIEVDPAVFRLTSLAAQIARRRFTDHRDRVLLDLPASKAQGRRVLILGFDRDSLDDFVRRFWFDLIEPDGHGGTGFASLPIRQDGIGEIGVACLDGSDVASRSAVERFMASPCTLFVLIDIQQIGASENLLHRSGITLDSKSHPTVVVVQSIRELENSSTVAEALNELRKIVDRSGKRPAGVLVNDELLFHSTLASALIGSAQRLQTVVDETEIMASIPPSARPAANEILRNWQALTA